MTIDWATHRPGALTWSRLAWIQAMSNADPAHGYPWQTSAWAWWVKAEVETRGLGRRLRAVEDAFRAVRMARESRGWQVASGERPFAYTWRPPGEEVSSEEPPFRQFWAHKGSDPCAIAAEIIAFERGDG